MKIRFYLALSFLLTIATISLQAQEIDRGPDIRRSMWHEASAEFNVSEIPAKWEKEDAVILASQEERAYRKPPLSSKLIEEISIHQRIKILSQIALEEYGQFTFKKSSVTQGVSLECYAGFKIIKPDGREIIIDEKQASEEKFEVDSKVRFTDLKLAIPNLEVGDILDYYIYYNYKFPTFNFYSFDPAIFILRKKYPLVYEKIQFAVLRRCYINLKTLNGAPEFKLLKSGDEDVYELEYSDMEKIEPFPWFYPYRSIPTVKFKVTYASPAAAYQYPNLLDQANPGVLNDNVNNGSLAKYINSYMGAIPDFSGLKKYMKTNFKSEKDHSKLVKEAFYYQRHNLSVKFQEYRNINGNNTIGISPFYFVKGLSSYFKKAKIPYSYIVGAPKSIGIVDDIILEEEVMIGLKVSTNPPIYITSFTTHSILNELGERFDGSEVLVSSYVNTGASTFSKEKLPQSTAEDNVSTTFVDWPLSLSGNMQQINITRNVTGIPRLMDQELLMDIYDYKHEEQEKYDLKPPTHERTGKKLEETRKKLKEYQEERSKKLSENLTTFCEVHWDVEIDTVHSLNILETGRSIENPKFKYEFVIETDELVTKVGPNYLISIGKLMKKQLELEKEYEGDREFDIYMNYPRSFISDISVEIPSGYDVQGIEKMSINVENGSGLFRINASFEDEVLRVRVEKSFKNDFEPAENWNKLLDIINAASDFSELKLLLKKQ